MMTAADNERLAVLESQYAQLQVDVTEIKSDVKALVVQQQSVATALAVKSARDERADQARGSMGTWVRSFVPWMIAGTALILTLLNSLDLMFDLIKHP